MNADGTDQRRVTPEVGQFVAWSPDGRYLLISGHTLFVVRPDGTGRTEIHPPGAAAAAGRHPRLGALKPGLPVWARRRSVVRRICSMTGQEPTGTLELRHAATDRATIVVVPRRRLFAIDGVGGPGASDFRFASGALRAVSDALRHRLRAAGAHDPGKPPIEVAWWSHPELAPDAMADAFADRSSWHWQQLVEIPDRASDDDATAAIDEVGHAAGRDVALVRTVEIVEGRSAQILNIGVDGEAGSIRRLAAEIEAAGLRPHGHLHQIFVSDREVAAPARARSILRLPIEG